MVETWNSANLLFYGRDGDLASADREDQEIAVLALHLLKSALVHVNTILVQRVLEGPAWANRLTDADPRGLSPLFWTDVNPYGKFSLDTEKHSLRSGHASPLLRLALRNGPSCAPPAIGRSRLCEATFARAPSNARTTECLSLQHSLAPP